MNHKQITNNETILSIDTSSNQEISTSLSIRGKVYEVKQPVGKQKAQVVLPQLQALLEKNQLTFSDVTDITVNIGPGSFTGLRVGVAIANTLGTLLRIPINGLPLGQLVEPRYI